MCVYVVVSETEGKGDDRCLSRRYSLLEGSVFDVLAKAFSEDGI